MQGTQNTSDKQWNNHTQNSKVVQSVFACSKPTMETIEQCVKSVQR